MVSSSYFWNDVIFTTDQHKRHYIGSACRHSVKWMIFEIIVFFLASRAIFNFTNNISYNYPSIATTIKIIYFIIFIVLVIDFINNGLACIRRDISMSLEFDFKYKSINGYGPDHAKYSEPYAYKKCKQFNNTVCPICMDEIQANDVCKLLHCGHLYHKGCLEQYEDHAWHGNRWPYSYGNCAQCKRQYHAYYEAYDYDPDYQRPLLDRGISYPGRWAVADLYWNRIGKRFKKHSHDQWVWYLKYSGDPACNNYCLATVESNCQYLR